MSENLLDEGHNDSMSMSIKESMKATAPWMKFLGVLFMVIGGIYAIIFVVGIGYLSVNNKDALFSCYSHYYLLCRVVC